jgi:N6-L-threonylcarbamoyladenine synthase
MTILSIETSCDETAVSIVKANGDFPHADYTILGNALFSQINIHKEYGGVFPSVAKREHAKTLVPMLNEALTAANLIHNEKTIVDSSLSEIIHTTLYREEGLADVLLTFLETHTIGHIDLIAVTSGPGLEPALWVGISFAKALASITKAPLVPINHMEGHILSSIFTETKIPHIVFPALALLISGGHTELVLMRDFLTYEKIGETRDDAVGEAFDKVARMMGLPYPGGPEVSARAQNARARALPQFAKLPKPMIDSADFDFSFSGLKTAVRYAIGEKKLTGEEIEALARDFEDVVTDVLRTKTEKAVRTHDVQTIIVGGGVSANTYIREQFIQYFGTEYPDVAVYFPPQKLSTDNSIMIALAGHAHAYQVQKGEPIADIHANGNLSL